MPALAPLRLAPVSVTVFPVPTFLSLKLAVPPVRLTMSPPIVPLSERVSAVALLLPSYCLLSAVKLPVMCFAVMLAVALAVVFSSV